MDMQQAAWNRGDIDAFMEGYDRADSTTFVSGDEITHGWQTGDQELAHDLSQEAFSRIYGRWVKVDEPYRSMR